MLISICFCAVDSTNKAVPIDYTSLTAEETYSFISEKTESCSNSGYVQPHENDNQSQVIMIWIFIGYLILLGEFDSPLKICLKGNISVFTEYYFIKYSVLYWSFKYFYIESLVFKFYYFVVIWFSFKMDEYHI